MVHLFLVLMEGVFHGRRWIILYTCDGCFDIFWIIKKNTLPSIFVMLKLLVSCYMSFVLRNIKLLICIPFSPKTWARVLVALIPWKLVLHHKHCHIFSSSLRMWSSPHIDEMKSILVLVYALFFSLLKYIYNFKEY